MLLTRTLKVEKQGLRKNQGPTKWDFEELQITRTQKLEKQGLKKIKNQQRKTFKSFNDCQSKTWEVFKGFLQGL